MFSLGWGVPSIVVHYAGAICFFWGMVSLHGLTLFVLGRLSTLAPDKCRALAGVDRVS